MTYADQIGQAAFTHLVADFFLRIITTTAA